MKSAQPGKPFVNEVDEVHAWTPFGESGVLLSVSRPEGRYQLRISAEMASVLLDDLRNCFPHGIRP